MRNYINLELYQRTSEVYELYFTTDGVPENLEGWTIYFTVKNSLEDPETSSIITKDIVITEDPGDGKVDITLTPDDTDIIPKVYWYDITVKDEQGNVNVVAFGRVKVTKHATQRT